MLLSGFDGGKSDTSDEVNGLEAKLYPGGDGGASLVSVAPPPSVAQIELRNKHLPDLSSCRQGVQRSRPPILVP